MNTVLLPELGLTEKAMLPCLSKQLLDMECPGCGLQRSVAYLLQGDIVASFMMYPGLYPVMGLFLFLGLDRIFQFSFGQKTIAALGLLSVATILTHFIIKIIT